MTDYFRIEPGQHKSKWSEIYFQLLVRISFFCVPFFLVVLWHKRWDLIGSESEVYSMTNKRRRKIYHHNLPISILSYPSIHSFIYLCLSLSNWGLFQQNQASKAYWLNMLEFPIEFFFKRNLQDFVYFMYYDMFATF